MLFLRVGPGRYGRSSPAGGQFSSFMPSDRPREASTEVADVVDVLGLEAVGRADGELEVVDRAQQDRVDLGRGAFGHRAVGALQVGEHRQLVDQHRRGVADRLLRLDDAVGLDVEDQLVEVGALLDTGALDGIADAAHRAERRVEQDVADRAAALGLRARGRRLVAAAPLDLDLHLDLAAGREVRDHVLGVDDLDVVVGLDVGGRHSTLAALGELQQHVVAVVELHDDTLEVQQDVDHVLLHAVERRVLVQHARDADLGRRVARHRGQQDAAQRVAQRVAVATLERLHHDLRVEGRRRLDVDDARFQQSIALHAESLSESQTGGPGGYFE